MQLARTRDHVGGGSKRRHPVSSWGWLPIALATSMLACSGGAASGPVPVASIGASQRAELAFRPLMRRWVLGSDNDRQRLDDELAAFVLEFPDDPLLRLAQVLRAFNAVDRGDLDRAETLAKGEGSKANRSPMLGPPGTAQDLATLVVGSVERRRGRYPQALERLAPLHHRLIDPFATARLNEELVLTALGAQRYDDAIRFMEGWRSEAAPDQETEIVDEIKKLIADVPKERLRADLERRSKLGIIESGIEMARLVAQQLAVYAVWDRDSELARLLVNDYGALLEGYGEAVARLAVDVTRGRVTARTVGVVLSLRTPAHGRRSADAVAGMAFGMGLPGSGSRLVTREADATGESVRRALAELAGEGAAVMVAGIDPLHSAEAAAYARDNSIPIIVITAAPAKFGSPFLFELGEPFASTTGRLLAAVEGKPALMGDAAALEPDAERVSFRCLEPPTPAAIRGGGVDALVLRDGAYCDNQLWGIAGNARVSVWLGLGVAPPGRGKARQGLAAGIFPVDERAPDPRLASWLRDHTGPPSWWTALGHDAAVLANQAVADLTESGTDVEEVRARRLEATSGLGAARAELWTTDAKGFGGEQRIEREVKVWSKTP